MTSEEKDTYMFVRGERLITIMEKEKELLLKEELNFNQLQQHTKNFIPVTKKRQFAIDPIVITELKITPAVVSNKLTIQGVANSDSGKQYEPRIMFSNVVYEDEDQPDNITFRASDNRILHILPIDLRKSHVKVKCDCLDFYWRFATWNFANHALINKPPPPYTKKPGSNRPPANIKKTPGLCKHLIKLALVLQQSGMIKY